MRIFTGFLFVVLVSNFAFAGFQEWKYMVYDRFRVWQNPDRLTTIKSTRIQLRNTLLYNK